MNQNHILFFIIPLIWASNAFIMKLLSMSISLDTYNFLRFLCVTPVLFFVKKSYDSIPKLFLISLLWFVLNFYFQGKALSSSLEFGYFSLGSITTSILVIIISALMKIEKINFQSILSFLFAMIGITLITVDVGKDFSNTMGLGYLLLSNLSIAIGTVLLKKFNITANFSNIALICLIAANCMFFISIYQNGFSSFKADLLKLDLVLFLTILFSAFVVTLLSGKMWIQVVNYCGPSLSSFSMFLFPIFSIFLGIIFLNESVTWVKLLAFVLIIISVLISLPKKNNMREYILGVARFKTRS